MGPPLNLIQYVQPTDALMGVVRFYVEREAIGALVHPVPARAVTGVEFIFSDPFEIHWRQRPLIERAPRTAIVGLQTHPRVRLVTPTGFHSFAIIFQPAGLFQLLRIAPSEITNADCDARGALGPWISWLHERLEGCRSFPERVKIVDDALVPIFLNRRTQSSVDAAIARLLVRNGSPRVRSMADAVGLSTRQFDRRFKAQVGLPPKLYTRIARFEAALDCKARSRNSTWADIAQRFGYHDQMHLIHDFEEFSGEYPTRLVEEVAKAERTTVESAGAGQGTEIYPRQTRILL